MMNRLAMTILLLFLYLGLARSVSITEVGMLYIPNEQALAAHFKDPSVSVVLADAFASGLVIKTYFHRYHIVYGYRASDDVVARVSKRFYQRHIDHIGLAVYSRGDREGHETLVPIPAGSLLIGDRSYGTWEINEKGIKTWQFHRAYRNYPEQLGWRDWVVTYDFYLRLRDAIDQGRPFSGLSGEFGEDGAISKLQYPMHLRKNQSGHWDFRDFFEQMISMDALRVSLRERASSHE